VGCSLTRNHPTYLIVQARPEAVVDVAAPAVFDYEPAEAALQPLYAVIHSNTCAWRGIGVRLAIAVRAVGVTEAASFLPHGSLLLVFFNLGIQTRHDALEAPQSVQKLGVLRLATLARRTARARKDAFDFGAQAVGAWLLLVAFDLQSREQSQRVYSAGGQVRADHQPFVSGM
jgi:hypothetical protein